MITTEAMIAESRRKRPDAGRMGGMGGMGGMGDMM